MPRLSKCAAPGPLFSIYGPFCLSSCEMHLYTLPCTSRLIALTNKVVLQRLDGLCCVSCHTLLAVMSDENSLLRLGDGDTLTALKIAPLEPLLLSLRLVHNSYLAGIGAAVLSLGKHVALAGNVQTLGKCLVNGSLLAGHDACEVLHLLGANLSIISSSA